MANIPQKSPDPTEDTFNAIKEAMANGEAERRAPPPPFSETPPAAASADLFKRPIEPASADRHAAAAPRRQ